MLDSGGFGEGGFSACCSLGFDDGDFGGSCFAEGGVGEGGFKDGDLGGCRLAVCGLDAGGFGDGTFFEVCAVDFGFGCSDFF